jgi:uncharacterized protein
MSTGEYHTPPGVTEWRRDGNRATFWDGACGLRSERGARYTSAVRLTSDEVQFLARKILKTLVKEGKIEFDSESRVEEAMIKVITEELMVEDKLNEEVREVLLQHANDMQRSNITYTEMFKMVKKKLAKEKGIIL